MGVRILRRVELEDRGPEPGLGLQIERPPQEVVDVPTETLGTRRGVDEAMP